MHIGKPFVALLFLLSSGCLTCMTTALLRLGRLSSKEVFKKIPKLFFFQHFLQPLFGVKKWEGLFMALSFGKQILYLCYGVLTVTIFISQEPFLHLFHDLSSSTTILFFIVITVTISVLMDFFVKLLATASPILALKLFASLASLLLTLFAPLTALFFMKVLASLFPNGVKGKPAFPSIKEQLLEVLHESELSSHLDPQERKLILSVANFKERTVREVMVPRIDVVCLSEETHLQQAAEAFIKERYSRLPTYKDTIDHITGVLLYKDVLSAYTGFNRQESIHSLIKPVLYTPETKKISHLLQEFRNKQLHIAIVVDEYGGTEGIITIEDILEELVGDIEDEDDVDQGLLYSTLPSGGWIVDARMSILEMERELFINIPSSVEYDTLGGYIYHRAGAIPSKGWRLHHDDFDLEILSSDERSIEKVKILPGKG